MASLRTIRGSGAAAGPHSSLRRPHSYVSSASVHLLNFPRGLCTRAYIDSRGLGATAGKRSVWAGARNIGTADIKVSAGLAAGRLLESEWCRVLKPPWSWYRCLYSGEVSGLGVGASCPRRPKWSKRWPPTINGTEMSAGPRGLASVSGCSRKRKQISVAAAAREGDSRGPTRVRRVSQHQV